ncbi:MAG: APC family permease, partial [Saprospiraceae bacterium]|nr:APC family permease [Saprospiraceae bacterium]
MKGDKLKRTIGLTAATSIGLGAMLGAGIFVFPGLAGGDAGFGAIFSFLIGGVVALLVALCTAELATAMPQSGGGYFYVSRAFGPFFGTVAGISQWMGLIFASAFYLLSFGEYATSFLAEMDIEWTTSRKLFSFIFTFILLIINILGTRKVGWFQNIMVISLTTVLVLIFSYGVIDFLGVENKPTAYSEIIPKSPLSVFTTTALIFTSYLGFVQIANIGAEIKKPSKNLPLSLIGSVLIATTLYVFVMWVCIATVPYEELNELGENATIETARKLLGRPGALAVVFAAILAALSSANASIISASRSVFALSKDVIIPDTASRINSRFGTPHIALIFVAVPVALILLRDRLEVFAEVASILHLIIYAGICFSVLRYRRNPPFWYIPTFRLKAAKYVSGIGGFSCLVLILFMRSTSILISVGIVLLIVAYYLFRLRKKNIKLEIHDPPHLNLNILNPSVLIPVDISEPKKDLPKEMLKAIPISRMLLLGYLETPEQSESEQSKEEFTEKGKEKMEDIIQELQEAAANFDNELIFGTEVKDQIRQVIEEEDFEFILKLEPVANLSALVIPIHDKKQINTKLSTIIYKIKDQRPVAIKVVLVKSDEDDDLNETQIKTALEHQ